MSGPRSRRVDEVMGLLAIVLILATAMIEPIASALLALALLATMLFVARRRQAS